MRKAHYILVLFRAISFFYSIHSVLSTKLFIGRFVFAASMDFLLFLVQKLNEYYMRSVCDSRHIKIFFFAEVLRVEIDYERTKLCGCDKL